MADQRKTTGQWIDGKWVTTSIGSAKGADDTSATVKDSLQNVTGLAAKAKALREEKERKKKEAADAAKKVSMMDANTSLRSRYGGGSIGALMGGYRG
jgi:hypothetical protein